MRWAVSAVAALLLACQSYPDVSDKTLDIVTTCSGGVAKTVAGELRAKVLLAVDTGGALGAEVKQSLEAAFFRQGWEPQFANAAYLRYVDCVEGRTSINEAALLYEERARTIRSRLARQEGVTESDLREFDQLVQRRKGMLSENKISAFTATGADQDELVLRLLPVGISARDYLNVSRGFGRTQNWTIPVLLARMGARDVPGSYDPEATFCDFDEPQTERAVYCACFSDLPRAEQCLKKVRW